MNKFREKICNTDTHNIVRPIPNVDGSSHQPLIFSLAINSAYSAAAITLTTVLPRAFEANHRDIFAAKLSIKLKNKTSSQSGCGLEKQEQQSIIAECRIAEDL